MLQLQPLVLIFHAFQLVFLWVLGGWFISYEETRAWTDSIRRGSEEEFCVPYHVPGGHSV